MLKRPIPWLVRTVPVLDKRARSLRSRVLSALARSQLGDVVAPAEQLAEHLARAAASRVLRGAAALEEIASANLAAHGGPALAAATLAAIGLLSAPRERSRLARAAARVLERAGHIHLPLEILARVGLPRARLEVKAELLAQGVTPAGPVERRWTPEPRRILYHAAQSLPHLSSGYAIRTHWLVRSLRDKGWDVTVANRLGYPNDRYEYFAVSKVATSATIDGVPYRFRPTREQGMAALDIPSYQAAASAALIDEAAAVRPVLIHSASNYAVGLAGGEAARRLGIPSIFEVRGLWHMSRASERPSYLDSDHYRMMEGLEAQAARMADHVLVITEAVADILAARGVERGKMSILPNAVDLTAFARRPRDPELAARFGLAGKLVIGYVGTFKDYEGLDLLLEAVARLRGDFADRVRLLLVGDGPVHGELMALVRRLGIGDLVVFTGRAPHDQIQAYYALVDVMVFPRRGTRVCEVVSPIKPFEAMAMGVPILASDVAALAEIIEDEVTGLLHRKDDLDSLCSQLMRLVDEPDLRSFLAARAEAWVRAHRSWSSVADIVADAYTRLIESP